MSGFKSLRREFAESERHWRLSASTNRLIRDLKRPAREVAETKARHAEADRMLEEQLEPLQEEIRQLRREIERRRDSGESTEVVEHALRQLERRQRSVEARINRLVAGPGPVRRAMRELGEDLKDELGIVGRQLVLLFKIVVANVLFFGTLLLVLPYLISLVF